MRDLFFLRQKAEKATKGDFPVAIDLLDTLKAHEDGCVGMAANMIGVNKAIIAVNMGFMNVAMFNPKIVKRNGKYETEEGCLSLDGVRKCVRYQEIDSYRTAPTLYMFRKVCKHIDFRTANNILG